MKYGVRKPSINRSIKARTTGRIKRSAKKAINPLYGKKGMGLINNPKKAIYNKAYNKTTVSARDIGKTASGSSVVAMIYLALIAIILYLFLDGWWKIIPIVLGIISLAGMVGLYVQLIQYIANNYVVSFILFAMLGTFFYFFCDWLGVYPATIPIALIVTYIIGLLYPNPKVDELVEEIEEPEVDEEDLRIKKLEGLLAVGLLTQEEFDEKMKEI
ncbi:SHOCT domain-containing protein [Globicatella sp. PHS-GS-PNBC-21-1553]|uniref:SHOCT domain-containing protein n=1 Tax=Globicatella sp. PHS-GS-PNBC-21-1553 TaxID=2885764 RepID=UPI00298EFE3B|nr:SHOCT domain-containing protein [Globicatella sp. PHS-GS-PNBC-21-1553]WPC08788.1 SHOCT domain-containing protein [Globicatella sp. PHS-GS-PNBC-21-1553]